MEPSRPPRIRDLPLGRRVAAAGWTVALIGMLLKIPSIGFFRVSNAVLHVLNYTTVGLFIVAVPIALGGTFAYRRQEGREARERAAESDSTGHGDADHP